MYVSMLGNPSYFMGKGYKVCKTVSDAINALAPYTDGLVSMHDLLTTMFKKHNIIKLQTDQGEIKDYKYLSKAVSLRIHTRETSVPQIFAGFGYDIRHGNEIHTDAFLRNIPYKAWIGVVYFLNLKVIIKTDPKFLKEN